MFQFFHVSVEMLTQIEKTLEMMILMFSLVPMMFLLVVLLWFFFDRVCCK